MHNLVDLKGKRILVTGASSGIGKEIAVLLDRLEAETILVARREENLQEIVTGLQVEKSCYYTADLSELNKIEGLIKQIVAERGPLDGFVHSAGIASSRPLKTIKPDILDQVMKINFYSFVELCRCITARKRFSETGCNIVGISSTGSILGNSSKTAYCASKAAMDAAVRCMAKELANKHIRVNTVAPSFIETDIYDSFLEKGEGSKDVELTMARQYLGLGQPSDVANLTAFLLSEASRFITGSTIGVDGGKLSW
ncbi:MAG: SDR family oxidoreductase [Eubacterium sp.]|jgi:NAD(P)-dependent dehydrogenase (short-subunit alcohol dehydrogenase family)|nr:SDR family oxidoreductase [Eubacterium sp.]